MQIGRIENEPQSVYLGDSDKPAFGSTAMKEWITDPEMFYHRYIAKDVAMRSSPAFAQGHALEEALLENKHRYYDGGYKTECAKLQAKREAEPEKLFLTSPAYASVTEMIDCGLADSGFMAAVSAGQVQVTYRYDRGPFYLQARVDLELAGDISEQVLDRYDANPESTELLVIDLKKTVTHYGQNSFRRGALWKFHYPIQEALYKHVINKVTGTDPDRIQFRFHAISEDLVSKAYNFIDIDDAAWGRVQDGIGELEYRYNSKDWSDFERGTMQVLVPDNYLQRSVG